MADGVVGRGNVTRVTLRLINPDGLPTPATYTQVVVASGSGL